MKHKKLFAILTLVCFMFTLMPVAAFANDDGILEQLPKPNVQWLTETTTMSGITFNPGTAIIINDSSGLFWNFSVKLLDKSGRMLEQYTDESRSNQPVKQLMTGIFMNDVLTSGKYTLQVQYLGDNVNCANSNITEVTYDYTNPGTKYAAPTVAWENGIVSIGNVYRDAHVYVQFKFIGENESARYSCSAPWSESQVHYQECFNEFVNRHGAGEYEFRARVGSDDITQIYHSDWSNWSGVYTVTGSSVQSTLENLNTQNNVSAADAIAAVQQLNTNELMTALSADNQTVGVAKEMAELEGKLNLTANVALDANAGFTLDTNKVSIVGAGFNAADSNEAPTFTISKPQNKQVVPNGYANDVQMEFTLSGVETNQDGSLIVPIRITMPVPDGIDAQKLCIFHYEKNGEIDVINPYVYQNNGIWYASFTVDSLSPFVFAQKVTGPQLPVPTNLRWEDRDKGLIGWNPVAGAEEYEVLVFHNGVLVRNKQLPHKDENSSCRLLITDMINASGAYTFKVSARGTGYEDSTFVDCPDVFNYNRPDVALTTPSSVQWYNMTPRWIPNNTYDKVAYYDLHYFNIENHRYTIGGHYIEQCENDGFMYDRSSNLVDRLEKWFPNAVIGFTVQAVSKNINQIANSAPVYSTNNFYLGTVLTAPTNVTWANKDQGIISWNGPVDSTGYEVIIQRNGYQIGRMGFGNNLRPDSDGKYYVYVGNLINDDGDYTVAVRVLGDGQTTQNSAYTVSDVFSYERPDTALPTPGKGEWRDNFASWTAIKDNSLSGYLRGYMVQYARNGENFNYDTVDRLEKNDRDYLIHYNSNMFAKYGVNKNSNENYTFVVQANSNNLLEVANSRPSVQSEALNETAFRELKAPTGLKINKNNDEYALVFYPVANTAQNPGNEYHLKVSRDGVVIFDDNRGYAYDRLYAKLGIGLTDLITEYGTYTIQICANGDAGYSSDSEYATITYVNQRPFSGGGSYTPAPSQPTTSTTTDMATGTTTTTVTLSNGSAVSNTDSSVEIKVAEVENKVLNAAAKMARSDDNIQVLGDKENTISISAENKVSGTVQTTFEQPMKVTVPVDKKVMRDVKDTSKLTLAKVVTNTDGSVELIYMGGSYDETTGTFNAKVDEDGDYVLVEKADLVKIELNIGKTDVKHNDVTSKMDVAPKINEKDGRTELPLRYLGEALGFEIEWNNNTVTITKDDIRFDLMIGQEIPGFGKPYIESDRTMVSARYVSEMLGANVIWDPIAEQVVVVK